MEKLSSKINEKNLDTKKEKQTLDIEKKEKEIKKEFINDLTNKLEEIGLPNDKKIIPALIKLNKLSHKEREKKINTISENTTEKINNNKDELFKNIKELTPEYTWFIDTKYTYTNVKNTNTSKLVGITSPYVYEEIRENESFRVQDHQLTLTPLELEEILFNPNYPNIEDTILLIDNSNNLEDFISKLNSLDSASKIELLNTLSYIANVQLYNRNMFDKDKMIKAAENALSTKIDPETFFNDLKQSLENGENLNEATCIQIHTFISQIAEKLGFKSITSTADIGISHRLAIIKDPETKKLYLISDGMLLEGNNYKQIIQTYQKLVEGRTVLKHYIYDSKGKQIATISTETEKQATKNISGYNTENLFEYIFKRTNNENLSDLHKKNEINLQIGNTDRLISYQHTFDSGFYVKGQYNENKITWEGNKIQNFKGIIGKGNDNYDLRLSVGLQNINYGTYTDSMIYGEISGLKEFSNRWQDTNIKTILYGNGLITIDPKAKNEKFPITNSEFNIGVATKIETPINNNISVYGKGAVNLRIDTGNSLNQENKSHNASTFIYAGKETSTKIGAGIKYKNNNIEINTEGSIGKGDGKTTIDLATSLRYEKTNLNINYTKEDYSSSILPDRIDIKGEMAHRINNQVSIYGGIEYNQEDNTPDNVKYYAGVKLRF